MSSYSSRLDSLIEDIGGCGSLQKLLCILIHITVILAAWSLLGMAFIGYDPGFTCRKLDVNANKLSSINMSEISTNRLCSFGNYSTCSSYLFPTGIKTVISEVRINFNKNGMYLGCHDRGILLIRLVNFIFKGQHFNNQTLQL
jgi:hypothetical protein